MLHVIKEWLHHLFEPHCPECAVCKECETLRTQLEIANSEKAKLLSALLELAKPASPVAQPSINLESIKPITNNVSWNERRRILEMEDRKAAQIHKQRELEIMNNKLETELKLDEAIGEE